MRLKYFLEDLISCLERNNKFEIKQMTQPELKYFLENNIDEYGNEFPMICYEHTEDSPEEVSIEDTKFLNDKEHDGIWLIGEKFGEVVFLLCLKEDDGELEIDTFEVANSERGNKISTFVIDYIEYCAAKYFDAVYISPFDTNAMNFWKHQGYTEDYGGYYTKEFNEYDEDF